MCRAAPRRSNRFGQFARALASSASFWAAALAVLSAAAYFPFVYGHAFGEWDSYRVAAGVLEAVRQDLNVATAGIRNNSVSYAYSYFLLAFEDVIRAEPTALYAIMNYANAAAATLATLPFFVVVRRYWGLAVAVSACVTLIAVPVWWNLALYGHPMTMAVLCFLLSLTAAAWREDYLRSRGAAPAGLALDGMVVGLLALTLMFRLDAVLLFPMLTACLRLEGKSWLRSFALSIGWALLALLVFLGVRQAIFSGGGVGNVLGSVGQWHDPGRVLPNLVRGTTIFVLSCHPLLLGLFGLGAVLLFARRAWADLFFLLPTMLLNFLFWLPNPSPGRHFLYVAPVLAAGVGLTVVSLVRRAGAEGNLSFKAAFTTASLVLVALLTAEAYFPIVQRAYPWKYGVQDYSARAPVRAMTANKARIEQYFQQAGAIGERLVELPTIEQPYLVVADPRPVEVEILMHSPSSASHMRPTEEMGVDAEFPVVTTERNVFHLLDVEDDFPRRLIETAGGDLSAYKVVVDEGNPLVAHAVARYGEAERGALGLQPLSAATEQR